MKWGVENLLGDMEQEFKYFKGLTKHLKGKEGYVRAEIGSVTAYYLNIFHQIENKTEQEYDECMRLIDDFRNLWMEARRLEYERKASSVDAFGEKS